MKNFDHLCENCPMRPKLKDVNSSRLQTKTSWSASTKTHTDGLGYIMVSDVDPSVVEKCTEPRKIMGLGRKVCGAGVSVVMRGSAHPEHCIPEKAVDFDDIHRNLLIARRTKESPSLPQGYYKHRLPIEYVDEGLFVSTGLLVGQHHTLPEKTEVAVGVAVRNDEGVDPRPFVITTMRYPDNDMYFAYRNPEIESEKKTSLAQTAFGLMLWLNAPQAIFDENYSLLPR